MIGRKLSSPSRRDWYKISIMFHTLIFVLFYILMIFIILLYPTYFVIVYLYSNFVLQINVNIYIYIYILKYYIFKIFHIYILKYYIFKIFHNNICLSCTSSNKNKCYLTFVCFFSFSACQLYFIHFILR